MASDNILPYKGVWPTIDPGAFIAPNAYVIGDAEIGAETNIWFGCLVRGDMNVIWKAWNGGKDLPARACVEAKLADPKMLVEIMVTAVK